MAIFSTVPFSLPRPKPSSTLSLPRQLLSFGDLFRGQPRQEVVCTAKAPPLFYFIEVLET